MQFGTDDRGKLVCSQGTRVSDRPVIVTNEMVRQAEEIITGIAVGFYDLRRFKCAIRQG